VLDIGLEAGKDKPAQITTQLPEWRTLLNVMTDETVVDGLDLKLIQYVKFALYGTKVLDFVACRDRLFI
jgi:hypothetical protein